MHVEKWIPQAVPATADDQLRWLVDRACISDLLVAYARAVDMKDFVGLASLFAEDGALELPFARVPKRDIATSSAKHLGQYWATHHLSANHAIGIRGDSAQSRSYFVAAHVPDGRELERHADTAGWYDNTYRRIADVWQFVTVRVTFIWRLGGSRLEHE